ncbi:hypothetical protein GCM10010221_43740 [Streptomyces parvus]|nr:hypothetical protein GCM10010221_43740 [Streptomyces parvus]
MKAREVEATPLNLTGRHGEEVDALFAGRRRGGLPDGEERFALLAVRQETRRTIGVSLESRGQPSVRCI